MYLITKILGKPSSDLLKVDLNIIPESQCKSSYASSIGSNLTFGIDDKSMLCAGTNGSGKDTCGVRISVFFYVGTYVNNVIHYYKFTGRFRWSTSNKTS